MQFLLLNQSIFHSQRPALLLSKLAGTTPWPACAKQCGEILNVVLSKRIIRFVEVLYI
jgi:hypothetical protein